MTSIDSGSAATYTYNALGQRVEKLVGSTYTEYAYHPSGQEVGENNRSRWTVRVVSFAGKHLAHYNDPSGTDAAYFMHSTKPGSTSQSTDYSGSVAQDQLYYPWGQEWQMVGTSEEKRFASLDHPSRHNRNWPGFHVLPRLFVYTGPLARQGSKVRT